MIPFANLRSPSGHRIFVRILEELAPKVAKEPVTQPQTPAHGTPKRVVWVLR